MISVISLLIWQIILFYLIFSSFFSLSIDMYEFNQVFSLSASQFILVKEFGGEEFNNLIKT